MHTKTYTTIKQANKLADKITRHPMGCEAQLASLIIPHAHFSWRAILIRKVGQTDQFLACYQGSLVGLCVQDYQTLCLASGYDLNCSTLVNIQTDRNTHTHTYRQHFDQLIWKAQQAELKTTTKREITLMRIMTVLLQQQWLLLLLLLLLLLPVVVAEQCFFGLANDSFNVTWRHWSYKLTTLVTLKFSHKKSRL